MGKVLRARIVDAARFLVIGGPPSVTAVGVAWVVERVLRP